MRVSLHCIECQSQLKAGDVLDYEFTHGVTLGPPNNDGIYEGRCSKGHTVKLVLRCPKHELLFDAGTIALLDEFNREAILNFASALERAYEFFARMVARHFEVADADFEATWNLANRSERQFGAALMANAALTRTAPSKLLRKATHMAKLRNDVVHNGEFATHTQAHDYGKWVYDLIHELQDTLRKHAGDTLDAEELATFSWAKNKIRELASPPTPGVRASTYRAKTMLSPGEGQPFTQRLQWFVAHNHWVDWSDRQTVTDLALRHGMSPKELVYKLAVWANGGPQEFDWTNVKAPAVNEEGEDRES